ncbi:diacylglycerol/lipid kinase family protein [Leekyejoonella antrihumi]|uniref:Diacylglycerol kinase family lipid kinase n=1 Tax=Leekyejoonella antrihumi TaxID=1660198 RepID=A0A563E7C1_9MICO|nr:diacylglycerol kinase family protein [Leekyejoonella antrihumi]TWP38163.1 diacylglycerol kinase family lipid kinase [Leekyejoonella antrihumi]
MRRAAVIVNPTKFDRLTPLRARLEAIFRAGGWCDPLWIETTADDPGTGQTRQAVAAGVDLVCSLGGDGTGRCVAAGLVGSGIPLGVLAAGTGNLLARNLGLPHRRYVDGLRLALTGQNTAIDVMRIELDRDGDGTFAAPETGLVMTGIHLDAEIMASTSERLKKRVGWLAYPAAGARHAVHDRVTMRVETDRGDVVGPAPTTGVLVGNCGRLTGGIKLMPRASVQDGQLDAVVLTAPSVVGWVPLIAQILSGSQRSTKAIRRLECASLTVRCEEPAMIEIDGDVLGRAHGIRLSVDPLALTVRTT